MSFGMAYIQEDRERMVVRRFKFEEPRIEQIQDLEVCICMVFIESYLSFPCYHQVVEDI